MQLFARMKAMGAAAAPAIPTLARDAVGLAGLGAIAVGAYQLSHGLGWIVGGLEAVVAVLVTTPPATLPSITGQGDNRGGRGG